MSTFTIVMIVILVILIGVLVGLYIFGKKAEKKQAEQQEQMAAAAQVVSMLIIDKKKLRLKEAGLPQMVVDNTPKYLRRTKVPVVKAKIGAKIMTLMCENKVFEVLPVKKEVKAVVSGLYITEIKSVRGGSIEQPEKKKGFFSNPTRVIVSSFALLILAGTFFVIFLSYRISSCMETPLLFRGTMLILMRQSAIGS